MSPETRQAIWDAFPEMVAKVAKEGGFEAPDASNWPKHPPKEDNVIPFPNLDRHA